VASKRERQRRLERARTERRIARQAQKVRKRRQVQAIVGASLALILVVLGIVFVFKPFSSSPPADATGGCLWTPVAPGGSVKDVGTPPTSADPIAGPENMTITAADGKKIIISLDVVNAPCAAKSFAYLASKNFFNGTTCDLLSSQLKVLKCGDPTGDGQGGPAYQFADENLPIAPVTPTGSPSAIPTTTASASPSSSAGSDGPFYTTGQVIMVNTGKDTNGSQFYIVYGDGSSLTNAYTLIGTVTSGMDVVQGIVAGGALGTDGKPADQGKPKDSLTFSTVTVDPADGTATGSASPSASPSAG
jgi:peptidyl-prolyl cis-trans isomerase B (cyclophilin B)